MRTASIDVVASSTAVSAIRRPPLALVTKSARGGGGARAPTRFIHAAGGAWCARAVWRVRFCGSEYKYKSKLLYEIIIVRHLVKVRKAM